MRFMMIVKATRDSEANQLPSGELIAAMQQFNEEMVKAGVLVSGEGLHPSKDGVRISYPVPGGKPVVTDGPFTETKELIAGFWLIDVKSREEALQWALRAPDPHGHGEGQIELRPVFEATEMTDDPELLRKDAELRGRIQPQQ